MLEKATRSMYPPLIDTKSSDPSRMPAEKKAMEFTEWPGRTHTLNICDQKLYKVFVDIKWEFLEEFKSLIPRLGVMHLLMSFNGYRGTLIRNSGLSDFLRSAFVSTDKMLSGKNFPQNLRAFRIVVEELLRGSIDDMIKFDDLPAFLQRLWEQSPTIKLWVGNCFICCLSVQRGKVIALYLYMLFQR